MKHQKAFRKLNRKPAHRRALLRNLVTSLIVNGKVETTVSKAKELKRVADKMVTLGKKGDLHARRQALAYLMPVNRTQKGKADKTTAVHKLFVEIAPMYSERNGGYTRLVRTTRRQGDNAELAIVAFVEAELPQKKEAKKPRRRRKSDSKVKEVKEVKAEESTEASKKVEAPEEKAE